MHMLICNQKGAQRHADVCGDWQASAKLERPIGRPNMGKTTLRDRAQHVPLQPKLGADRYLTFEYLNNENK